jgi:hypothetical protein
VIPHIDVPLVIFGASVHKIADWRPSRRAVRDHWTDLISEVAPVPGGVWDALARSAAPVAGVLLFTLAQEAD